MDITLGGFGCSSYLLGVKRVVLVSLRVFSLKRYTVGAFLVDHIHLVSLTVRGEKMKPGR